MPTAHILRGRPSQPYTFGALAEEAPGPAPFVALDTDAPSAIDGFLPFSVPTETAGPDPASYAAGQADGLAEREAQVTALQAEVDRLSAALDDARAVAAKRAAFAETAAGALRTRWDEAVRGLEAPLIGLAVEVAEAVLDAPLSAAQRAAADAALAGAIDAVGGKAPVTVALHPVDLLHVQETGLAASIEATHAGLRWEADPGLAEGDWGVSTSAAAIQHIRADMMTALRARLSVPTS
ncbi:hypothetical protein [Rubrivirga sp. IMCC45206]|uniref:hypothetical protein n=1 Tax=Rubrivirga sp. IMCC45206 TaxID=3391614 RepID=UPI00398F9DF0